jgi:hypothetical protein
MDDDRHDPVRPTTRSRRSREPAPRGRTVRFGLSKGEFNELEAAAARARLARGAFAAEAALAAAGAPAPCRTMTGYGTCWPS